MGAVFVQFIHSWDERIKALKESVGVCRWIWKELINESSKKWASKMMTALAISTVFGVMQPWLLKFTFDGLTTANRTLIYFGLGAFLGCRLIQSVCYHIYMTAREWVAGENAGHLDKRSAELFFEKSLGQHIQDGAVLNASNMEKGRSQVLNIENMLIFDGFQSILELALSFIFLWFLSPIAGLIMTLLLLQYVTLSIYLNQQVIEVCMPIDKQFRKLNRHIKERWDKVERVKTCGKETEEVGVIVSWFGRIIRQDRDFWIWMIKIFTVRGLTKTAAIMIVISYGAWRVWHGDWTIGVLYPLYSWSTQVAENLWRIGHIEHQVNWNMPAVRSMKQALTLEPRVTDSKDAVVIPPENGILVKFSKVTHAYPAFGIEEERTTEKLPQKILDNVSFTIKPGEKVGLIGSSGAGKTTIIRLLQRYMDPNEGAILINGIDLKNIQLSSWLGMLAYIPQQAQIFDGTIKYNMTYGLTPDDREKVSDEELWDIMRRLQIDFGERLTDGLDTLVGRNGLKLSGGQAQRLMIGAAAIQKPSFMLIDEATSSLDSTTEKAVQKGLAEVLHKNMSALIITHRLSTIRGICNKFVVLKASDLLQNGDPQVEAVAYGFEELYQKSMVFRALARDQEIAIKN